MCETHKSPSTLRTFENAWFKPRLAHGNEAWHAVKAAQVIRYSKD